MVTYFRIVFIALFFTAATLFTMVTPVLAGDLWVIERGWGPRWKGVGPSPEALAEEYFWVLFFYYVPRDRFQVTSFVTSGQYTSPITYNFSCRADLTPLPSFCTPTSPFTHCLDRAYTGGGQCTKQTNPVNPLKSPEENGDGKSLNCPALAGNPIDISRGEKIQKETDYSGNGPFPLVFQRLYNSQYTIPTSLGKNWRHNYDRKLLHTTETDGDQFLTFTRANSKRIYFSQSGTRWVGDVDIPSHAKRLPNGWELTTTRDEIETYDHSGKTRAH